MRVRVRFTKLGRVRFVSHRDVARVWERAIRRAELPIAYSEGFSPRPKVHFGLALSVGHTSDAEYLDLDLRDPVELTTLPQRLTPCLPVGIDVTAAAEVATSDTSLQAAVDVVTWRFLVDGDPTSVGRAAEEMMARPSIPTVINRKGNDQQADLRPALRSITVEAAAEGTAQLTVNLATRPKSFRPAEVLTAFDPPLGERRVHRIEQWIIDDDGALQPPLAARLDTVGPPEPCLRAG
ncbi:MAG: DUF2344 domain-containing protein [Microthrixaceae bacterium]|nr:DUF2344 domain-containing protein [Microthrixaceae bacterium]